MRTINSALRVIETMGIKMSGKLDGDFTGTVFETRSEYGISAEEHV
jgi:hypothetical protein